MTNLTTVTNQAIVSNKAKKYQGKSRAASTLRMYRSAIADFDEYCKDQRVSSAPATPSTVANYLAFLADEQKVSTIKVKLAAIAYAHRLAHLPDPTVDSVVETTLDGIVRDKGLLPTTKKAVTLNIMREMVVALPPTLSGTRDRAVLLLGFGGMFRRSELVEIMVEDISLTDEHLSVLIRHSKTDQKGKGLVKHFQMINERAICPVRALHDWLSESGIESGPLFRAIDRYGHVRDKPMSTEAVAQIIKSAAKRIGQDPDVFAGHSLRRGGITSALKYAAEQRDVMLQTGHTDPKTLLHYNEDLGEGATRASRAAFGETPE